ncbi:MAG: CHAT domain-containing protein, partial [Leptolyngbya sp.]|nr:CHAT domain-containing protein [Candidatus Melainabacteria bacterium]
GGEPEADALYQLGQFNFSIGDSTKAETYFRESLAVEDRLKRAQQALQVRIALAHLMMSQKRPDDAMAMYKDALALATKSKDYEQIASVTDSMASALLIGGNLDAAEKLLNETLAIAQQNGSAVVQANAYINLAAVAASRRNNDLALERAQKAIDALSGKDEPRTMGLAHRQKGRAFANAGQFKNAIVEYQMAAKSFEEDVESVLQAQVLLSIGQLLLAGRQPQEAKDELKKAVEILKAEKETPLLIECMIALGAAEADSANYSAAINLHGEASKLAVSQNNLRGQYLAASEEGFDLLLQGKTENALDRFLDANKLINKSATATDRERAGVLRDLGLCYRGLGQLEAAIRYYSESAEAFAKAGDIENQALLTNSVAVVHLDMGRSNEFTTEFASARQLAATSKNQGVIACLGYNQAQFQYMGKQYDAAIKSYEETIVAAHSANDPKTECMALSGIGFAYLALNKPEPAKDAFSKAAQIALKQDVLEAQWDTALGLGKTYKLLGQKAEAEQEFKKAVALVEKERSHLSRDTFKTFNLDLRQECFLELIDLYVSENKADLSLELAEKSRARAFLDLLEGRIKRASADTVAVVIEGDGRANAVASVPDNAERQIVAMAEGHGDSTVRGVSVTPKASTLVESSAYSPLNASPPSIAEISQLVKRSGSHVVEYCILKDKLLIWVVLPSGEIKMTPPVVVNAADLKRKITEAHQSISQGTKSLKDIAVQDEARARLLKELYALLITPVNAILPNRSDTVVTFVPHGPLFSVPFAALLSPSNKYLIEERTVSYLPAIGVLRATEKLAGESDRAPDNTLLAFGNPITKVIAFLGTLPYAEKEVKKVAGLFGESKSTLEIGAKATKSAYRLQSPKNSVIHLATHGMISEDRPMESSLVLAPEANDDGLLTVKDILTMPPLKAKMVVLSACQTGRGKITGDGVVGLSRAFIIAGAPSVVVSQWNVDDVMTEYQMEHFYTAYLAGKTKVESLRDAQLKTISFMDKMLAPSSLTTTAPAKPINRANPRLWAAFQLIGESK